MKVLLLNSQFERGGAGRVAAILSNELARRGYDLSIVTDWSHWGHTYVLDNNIPILEITTKETKKGNVAKLIKWLKCVCNIRKYIMREKPDIIIATESMMFLCAWLARMFNRVPIIAADHTSFNRKIDPIIDLVRYKLYAKSDGLSILTQKDFNLLGTKYPQKKVIYNPLSFPILNHITKRRKIFFVQVD